eukprot:scaffold13892_cov75-Isochrysis_galbana.AAC.1
MPLQPGNTEGGRQIRPLQVADSSEGGELRRKTAPASAPHLPQKILRFPLGAPPWPRRSRRGLRRLQRLQPRAHIDTMVPRGQKVAVAQQSGQACGTHLQVEVAAGAQEHVGQPR